MKVWGALRCDISAFCKIAFTALLSISISGCGLNEAVNGPPRVVTIADVGNVGACYKDGVAKAASGATANLRKNFNTDNLLEQRFAEATCKSQDQSNNDLLAREMLQTGFTLVSVRCNDYFAAKGGGQTGVRTARSLIAPLVAVLTGIIALRDFNDADQQQDFLEIVTLASTGTFAALAIYEEQFLFGAENIDAVRELTADGLSTHRTEVLKKSQINFDVAVRQLIDHQMICTPANILELTKAAIKAGDVKPRNPGEPDAADPLTLAKGNLATGFNISTITDAQIIGLYWLASEQAISNEERGFIASQLGELAAFIDTDTGLNETQKGFIKQELDSLSLLQKNAIEVQVAAASRSLNDISVLEDEQLRAASREELYSSQTFVIPRSPGSSDDGGVRLVVE
ncbi:MAG: hypothetical protein AAGH53_09310 [Pseudomonadota bacterium]